MLFHTPEFGLFLLVVLGAFWLLRVRRTARHLVLLTASYFFYGFWNPKYLALLFFSTALDWAVGLALGREERQAARRLLLAASLTGNLGLLGVFKYYNFFAGDLARLLDSVGLPVSLPHLDVLLPVGISFYTFQTLSYAIDVYRRRLAPERSLLDFALFVAFFPQLVAGPILRAVDFLPQLHRAPALREEQFSSGVFRILVGLAKKIVIADFLAVKLVDPVFAAPGAAAGVEVLLAVYAYALQIYCDFSGYSDIAVGCGRLLGFDIVENFAAPYKARSVAEFWSRWHISLSTWFRDYLFLPLAYRVTRRLGRCADDPRRAQLWAYALTTLVVMLLVGLWHGAAWTFVAWGALHGIALALGRAGATARRQRSRGSALVAGIGTFHFICLGWVLFRSGTFATAAEVCAALTRAQPLRLVGGGVLAVMAIGFVTLLWPESGKASVEQRFVRAPTWVQALVVVLGLAVFQAMAQTAHPFIYFQF